MRQEEKWLWWYDLAKKYYEYYGDSKIHVSFKTKNGYEYDSNGKALGSWLQTQRRKYDKLSNERKELLKKIDFIPNMDVYRWEDMYVLAYNYYKYYGNSLVHEGFKTKNGYEYDPNGRSLGVWIRVQMLNYDNLSDDKKEKLKDIDIVLKRREYTWNKMYSLACIYYKHYGNLLMSENFKTKNGYIEDENGAKLGAWIKRQRENYNKLSEDRKLKFEKIGIDDKTAYFNEEKWLWWYDLAKKYYEYHGNLLIPRTFITKNGYEKDSDGKRLGVWIARQRYIYNNLSEEKIADLEKIGMIWNIRRNTNEIYDICVLNQIDFDLNKECLKHINPKLMMLKINYLNANNIPLTNEDGILHEIFKMSELNMLAKYKISNKDLFEKYDNNKCKKIERISW